MFVVDREKVEYVPHVGVVILDRGMKYEVGYAPQAGVVVL